MQKNCELTSDSKALNSSTSYGSLPPSKTFTAVGFYKGNRVAIKKIIKKEVYLNENLSREIKLVNQINQIRAKFFIWNFLFFR